MCSSFYFQMNKVQLIQPSSVSVCGKYGDYSEEFWER